MDSFSFAARLLSTRIAHFRQVVFDLQPPLGDLLNSCSDSYNSRGEKVIKAGTLLSNGHSAPPHPQPLHCSHKCVSEMWERWNRLGQAERIEEFLLSSGLGWAQSCSWFLEG